MTEPIHFLNSVLLRPRLGSCSHAITLSPLIKAQGCLNQHLLLWHTSHPAPGSSRLSVNFALSTLAQKVDDRKRKSLKQALFHLCLPHDGRAAGWELCPSHLRATLNSQLTTGITRNIVKIGEGCKCPQNQNRNSSKSLCSRAVLEKEMHGRLKKEIWCSLYMADYQNL